MDAAKIDVVAAVDGSAIPLATLGLNAVAEVAVAEKAVEALNEAQAPEN